MKPDIGQRLFIGLPGRELDAGAHQLLDAVRPGGVVLFARNIEDARQLRALTAALHARGIAVAIDQEGGRVNRLRNIIGECARDGRQTGRWLREYGIDINFAPVCDLALTPPGTDNALQERCWGRSADEVIAGAGVFLDELQAEGVAGCLKHFPGLGAATLDSHEELPVIERDPADGLAPFAALAPRAKAIMVGHAIYPALDPHRPASLSHAITTGLLRERLGFRGTIFTDDLEMGAINTAMPFAEAVVAAVRAGADRLLVCHSHDRILAAHEALTQAGLR